MMKIPSVMIYGLVLMLFKEFFEQKQIPLYILS